MYTSTVWNMMVEQEMYTKSKMKRIKMIGFKMETWSSVVAQSSECKLSVVGQNLW